MTYGGILSNVMASLWLTPPCHKKCHTHPCNTQPTRLLHLSVKQTDSTLTPTEAVSMEHFTPTTWYLKIYQNIDLCFRIYSNSNSMEPSLSFSPPHRINVTAAFINVGLVFIESVVVWLFTSSFWDSWKCWNFMELSRHNTNSFVKSDIKEQNQSQVPWKAGWK